MASLCPSLHHIALLLSLGYVAVILSRLAQDMSRRHFTSHVVSPGIWHTVIAPLMSSSSRYVTPSFHLICRLAQDMSRRHFTSYVVSPKICHAVISPHMSSRPRYVTPSFQLSYHLSRGISPPPSSLHSRTSCSILARSLVCMFV